MADTIGFKLGIEGEKEFKNSLKDINQSMKVLGSEMTLVASQFDKQDKSEQAVIARNSVLTKEIEEQKNKIKLLSDALNNASASFGENDSRTKAWQTQLNKAQAELNGMEKELAENNKSLKDTADGYDDAEKEAKEFGKEVEDSGEKAKQSGGKMETLGSIAKGLGVAFTAAFAAMTVAVKKVVGVIGDCVDVYANFDDSMRQVAATMGMSADEIGKSGGDFDRLAQAAKDAGASTKFSASEAAEALNYLALAGYDTNKSIETMPKVLQLAAAGGMDLAYTSDLVTDSMSALGLSTDELDVFMDQMAKTSQKSNTSVQQLGEAILVCAGTASMTGQDLDNINTALGVMADNGIKGAEGGTHLRNVLLSLSAPTEKGAKTLKQLGVEVYDAQGNMKQLDVVLNDLNKAMAGMSQDEKTAAIKSIFNKTDIAAVNSLLASTSGRFSELNGLILDSAGAAEEMANTMESGLAGTERSFKSAVEGLQIEAGEIFAGFKQSALTDVTEIVRDLTKGIAESDGDWGKLGESVGKAISDGLVKMNTYLPQIVEMAVGVITVFISGIADNIDLLAESSASILQSIIDGMNVTFPKLVEVAVPLLMALTNGIVQNLPMIMQATLDIVMTIINGVTTTLPTLIPQVVESVMMLISALVAATPQLLSVAVGMLEAVIQGVTDALPVLLENLPAIVISLVQNVLNAVPDIIAMVLTMVPQLITALMDSLNTMLPVLVEGLAGIVESVVGLLPVIIAQIVVMLPQLLESIMTGLMEMLPVLAGAVVGLLQAVVDALPVIIDALVPLIGELIGMIATFLIENIPILLDGALELFRALTAAIPVILEELTPMIPELVFAIGDALIDNLPVLFEAATVLFSCLLDAGPQIWKQLLQILPVVLSQLVDIIYQTRDAMRDVAIRLVEGFVEGWVGMKAQLFEKLMETWHKMVEMFRNFFGIRSPSTLFAGFGRYLIEGLWNGIQDMQSWIVDRVSSLGSWITDAIKSVFGIHSPSKVFENEIGKNLGLGIGIGFEKAMAEVKDDMADAIPTDFDVDANLHGGINADGSGGNGVTVILNIDNFYNNDDSDIHQLADEISVILAAKMKRREAAF